MSSLLTKPLVQHHLSCMSPIQLRDFPLGQIFWWSAIGHTAAMSLGKEVHYEVRAGTRRAWMVWCGANVGNLA